MNEFLLAVWKAFYPSYVPPTRPTSTNNIRNNLENDTLRDVKEHAFNLTEDVTSKYAYNLLPRIIEGNFDRRSLENFFKFEDTFSTHQEKLKSEFCAKWQARSKTVVQCK